MNDRRIDVRLNRPIQAPGAAGSDLGLALDFGVVHRLTIVVTGAATLALQLIASRIMTPFFGVSLFIWTGILAITLLCLALGYYLGGRYTRRRGATDLVTALYALPAIASLAACGGGLTYPYLFGPLARVDLLAGSFAACTILLAIPLMALSALNPLLIAIERAARSAAGDDAGSGQVFFLSTLGSVGGVLVAALYLIPEWSSPAGIGIVGAVLALLALGGAITQSRLGDVRRIAIGGVAALGLVLAATMAIANRDGGHGWKGTDARGWSWHIVAAYPSAFGTVKVVDWRTGSSGQLQRLLVSDGTVQNIVLPDGQSTTLFSYMLDATASSLAPEARRALVLGFGAGVIPRSLAARGIHVDAVEINPRILQAAREHLGYTEQPGIAITIADARTFVHACHDVYDVVFIDLFAGDGTPEHLVTREFMQNIRDCLAASGVVAMNSFLDTNAPAYHMSLMATIASIFGTVGLFEQVQAGVSLTNGFLVAARDERLLAKLAGSPPAPERLPVGMRSAVAASWRTYRELSVGDPALREHAPFTDAHNRATMLSLPVQTVFRRNTLRTLPDAVLAN